MKEVRLIDAEALKKALTSDTRDIYVFECLSSVLEKIDNAPTVEIPLNNDLISRKALKDALHNEIGEHALSVAIDRVIDNAPTFDQ